MSEYYYGKLEDMDETKICRNRGYGNTEPNEYGKWRVLAARLTFVIVFEHGVVAAITGLIYFIRKMNKIKYRTNRERDDDNKYDNGANKRPASTLVVNGIDGAAVTVHAGSNRQNDVVGDPFSGTVDDEMRRNDGIVVKNRNYSGFKDRREKNSPSVVVVDIENDEQENVNAPN